MRNAPLLAIASTVLIACSHSSVAPPVPAPGCNPERFRAAYVDMLSKLKRETSCPDAWEQITAILDAAISSGRIPGASVAVGSSRGLLFSTIRGTIAKGSTRAVQPTTLFDLASLTKTVATAPSILLLRDRGLLKLTDPVSLFLPEYAQSPIGRITIEQLLRHRGGLRDTAPIEPAEGLAILEAKRRGVNVRNLFFRHILPQRLETNPARQMDFQYSDLGYILLAEIVERISGLPLDAFTERNIYRPLGMGHTRYAPPLDSDCARAERMCLPNDNPTYYYLDRVGGSAGLYSTAADLAVFARMILNHGHFIDSTGTTRSLLSEDAIAAATSDPFHARDLRGLGFDIDTDYSCAPRGSFSKGTSFGHTGWTGTSLWIDPVIDRFVVILTNEVDAGKGPASAIRWNIADLVARSGSKCP